MKTGVIRVLLKLIICFILLCQYQISAARPVAAEMVGLKDYNYQHQEMNGKLEAVPMPQSDQIWTDEDYSHPRRRRPVHNKFDP
ncbi:hypothetical protein COLO4_29205 [Corchorus olitorius]|uniref:Uncharacterized protein n=1 Tax=Corchorus olitorius TaxID=93759 RepID=A0A1R3HFZ7_9ROSI|nr:hypothetical protein COLO4_29205 [Corchorus olitorius]